MFRRLRTKLTVLYAGLFGLSLVLVSAAVYAAVSSNVGKGVRSELEASSTVFDRIWALRAQQLEDGADLLSRDFGFREAVASRDAATITSALANLQGRLGADRAYLVDLTGSVISSDGRPLAPAAGKVLQSLDGEENAAGVMTMDGIPYQAISAPIMSPTLTGWVVFASKLDRKEMSSLERLSSIPLQATVLHRDGQMWRGPAAERRQADSQALSGFVARQLAAKASDSRELRTPDGSSIALVKPLKALNGGAPAVLVLRYPLAAALAPYRFMLETIAATGVLGFLVLLVGSWAIARSVTQPISALDDAARRLQRGEHARVPVDSGDEIGRLAESFNTMSAEIQAREQRITELAMRDPETDLPNRPALERAIGPMLEQSNGRMMVAAAIGIDRFTHVRGAIGYGMANSLVREIGAKVRQAHATSPLARLSSDVLTLVFLADDLDSAIRRAAELLQALEAPLELGDNTIDVSLSIGMAVYGMDDQQVTSLVERASVALDQAREGRRKLAVFDPALYGDPSTNLSLMSEMLQGIARGELILHHQPKLDLRRRRITGCEALVRWRHPTRGLMPPDLFIPMAEETGQIGALTEWVLGRAIEEQALLHHEGRELAMSINVSGRLLGDPAFADMALDMARGARGEMCFEITETAVIDNPEVALQAIDRFADRGIKVSIDDYGTGLSSLAYLKQIRADELKIDKSFVLKVDEGQKDALLVRSTIDLAHSLGMKVTAEGVETAVALALLQGMGCDIAQGFHIARPMPLKELLIFLAQDEEQNRRYG